VIVKAYPYVKILW